MRKMLGVAALAAVTVVSSLFFVAPASAGTNGQQIRLCSDAAKWVKADGTNEHGNSVSTGWRYIQGDGCYGIPGWWWVDLVKISQASGSTYCYVPKRQTSSDWTDCWAW